ncbi:MAG TPA: hypothetical protein VLB45_06880 [Nitrosopumilaceae archaeon]|nr:hypothetical protein [Nitrosopumilaceae archaeon]
MSVDTSLVHKALVSVVIEQTMLQIGDAPLLNEVLLALYQKHGCYIPDCYDHPEYLLDVFKDLEGSSYLVVADSIRVQLEEYSYHPEIRKFVEKISEIKCQH